MALASRFSAMARWCSKPLSVLLVAPVMVTLGAASIASAQVPGGSIRGVVSSLCLKSICPEGHSFNLAGVSLKLSGGSPGSASLSTVSDSAGEYQFSGVAAGTYTLEANLEGFQPLAATVTVSGVQPLLQDLRMELEGLHQQIEVRAEAPTISQQSTALPATITSRQLVALPLVQQKFKEALPLVPGVIRTPDGKLNIKGSVENQGMLLVDSAQTIDPITGSFAIEVPVDVVESLTVNKTPYSAEFGSFSGGLTTIQTKPPLGRWHYELMDFVPSLRGKSGHIVGIADDTPRLVFGGPLLKNKLNFSEAFEYQVIKRPVRGLAWPHNESKTQGFDSFTGFQYILSPQHLLTANVNVFPLRRQFANINSLVPQTASSDLGQRGFSLGATDHYQFASGALLTVLFNYTRFSSYAHGQGGEAMLVTPDGWRGNFFNSSTRTGNQEQVLPTLQLPGRQWRGRHQLMIGGDFNHRDYAGTSRSHPVLLLGPDGSLAERIDFRDAGSLGASDTDISGFAQDRWSFSDHLAVDLGLRYTGQTSGSSAIFAPRLGAVYSPGQGGKTIFRFGIGTFYDRVSLLAADFRQNPTRIVSLFDRSGTVVGPPLILRNAYVKIDDGRPSIPPDGDLASSPRNVTWNVEVDREVRRGVVLRVSYLSSQTNRLLVVGPQQILGSDPTLLLSNTAGLRYHEFETTAHFHPTQRIEANVSYIRSRARGDLNAISDIFVPFEQAVIRPNVRANLRSDIPNRLVSWGVFRLPYKSYFSPIVDVHSGFPYSNVDVLQNYVGTPNGQRFPTFFSLDMKLYREFHLPFVPWMKKHKFRGGVYVVNFTDHANPRDVFNNIASANFGHFLGFQQRTFGAIIDIVE